MAGFHCVLLVFVLAFLPSGESFGAGQSPEEFFAVREFRGLVRRDMAERMARTAAELAAIDHATRLLSQEQDLRFLNSQVPQEALAPRLEPPASFPAGEIPLDALARMLFSTPVEELGVQGFPPDMRAFARIRLLPPEKMREALRNALQTPNALELHERILARQRSLLASYDQLAASLLPLKPSLQGGLEEQYRLQNICNQITALDIYRNLLPEYAQSRISAQTMHKELAKAEGLAPKEPLILTAMADVLLRLDRPAPALARVGEALKSAPDFAAAHDVKGIALLRQHLPVLAAESFSRAVALAPKNKAYRIHRASAYLMLNDEENMCADFKKACALGDCEGLQWARSAEQCGNSGGKD